jgi:mannosyltransferase OCH1-like enzyme
MIPKIIHYVWVGNGEKPDLAHRCIASWKRHLSDYSIVEWGNDSLVDIKVAFVHEAFRMKKWAFVSDYLRLYALYKFGGFYFDTDLEVTANLDRFLDHRYLTGYENYNGNAQEGYFSTALIGAEKGSALIGKMLQEYDNEPFIFPDGSLNIVTNTKRITRLIRDEYNLPGALNPAEVLHLVDGIAR